MMNLGKIRKIRKIRKMPEDSQDIHRGESEDTVKF